MKETEQKKECAYMTPQDIVDKMINFTPIEWFKGNIMEPTAGDGNIVMAILNKKLELGMTPFEAMDSTYANELNNERYLIMLNRVKQWCEEHDIMCDIEHFTNKDARYLKLTVDYKVITNLPFGSWAANANLPNQIINNLNKPAVYLTKWSTGCYKKYVPHVKKFENVVFPGIVYDTLLWEYEPEYTEGDIWIYWPLPKLPKHKLKNNWDYLRNNMKCQIIRCNGSHNFRIRPHNGIRSGVSVVIDIPEELYKEICMKFNSKPYTGIHKEIFDLLHPKRCQNQDPDAILDYLYRNGFDYLFEE